MAREKWMGLPLSASGFLAGEALLLGEKRFLEATGTCAHRVDTRAEYPPSAGRRSFHHVGEDHSRVRGPGEVHHRAAPEKGRGAGGLGGR